MIITLQVICIVICIISFFGLVGENDEKQKPVYLTGAVAFMALAIAIEMLLK